MTFEEVLAASKNSNVTILDCRPKMQVKKGTIDNAVNLPAGTLYNNHTVMKQGQIALALKDAKIDLRA